MIKIYDFSILFSILLSCNIPISLSHSCLLWSEARRNGFPSICFPKKTSIWNRFESNSDWIIWAPESDSILPLLSQTHLTPSSDSCWCDLHVGSLWGEIIYANFDFDPISPNYPKMTLFPTNILKLLGNYVNYYEMLLWFDRLEFNWMCWDLKRCSKQSKQLFLKHVVILL